MAASSAKSGYGTLFKRAGTAIAEVMTVSGPNLSRDTIEVTHLTSDNGFKEFISGMADGGECTVTLNWIPGNSGHALLVSDLCAGPDATAVAYSVDWRGLGTNIWAFNGHITGFSPSGDKTKQLDATAAFKVTGKPTIS
jgi:hypothetical protein